MWIKIQRRQIVIHKRHSRRWTLVQALESNQLTKSSFQVTSQPKLQIRAQASSEPMLQTQTRVLSETTTKIVFRSSPICFHLRQEPILIRRNGQDAASSESTMDMVGHYAPISWEITYTLSSLMNSAFLSIQWKPLSKVSQKLKTHSSRKSTTQKPTHSKTKVEVVPSSSWSSKTFATAQTLVTVELYWVQTLVKMWFHSVSITNQVMTKKPKESKMEEVRFTIGPPPIKSSLMTKTIKMISIKSWI